MFRVKSTCTGGVDCALFLIAKDQWILDKKLVSSKKGKNGLQLFNRQISFLNYMMVTLINITVIILYVTRRKGVHVHKYVTTVVSYRLKATS